MTTEKETGGPAFGQVVELKCVHVDPFGATDWEPEVMMHGGLTVRDYFAAKALQGYLSSPEFRSERGIKESAKAAYLMADAMLAARQS